MTQPQKTGTPPAAAKPSAPERVIRIADPDHSLTFAAFTPAELRALQLICRDADNDVYAKNLLATAIARAETKS